MTLDRKTPWRWLCVECGTEGRGDCPSACPECKCPDAWYETNAHGEDPRHMLAIFRSLFAKLGPKH